MMSDFETKFPYQNVLVLGLAKSGFAAASTLLAHGRNVRVSDLNASNQEELVQILEQKGAQVKLGVQEVELLEDIDVLIKNPGIRYENVIVQTAMERNIPVLTEVELAGLLHKGTLIGITGSNGKTTTTTLAYEMLKESQVSTYVAGNIGTAASEVADRTTEDDRLVLELSSFQLQGIDQFRPNISVMLNIFEAHLDYHHSLENYEQAKANIFRNQDAGDYLVYNAEDERLRDIVKAAKATLVPFSGSRKLEDGAWYDETHVYFKDEPIAAMKDILLVGGHQLENILAAVAAAKLAGATNEGIQQVLKTFSGVEHRLQYIKHINGRAFYNDSKATNILATSKALSSFDQPTILLAGGLDRGNTFETLVPFMEHVKALIVFGETAEKLRETAYMAGIELIEFAKDVKEAAEIAYRISESGDVILLSPACASWDQYRTFEERGDMFVEAVHTLE